MRRWRRRAAILAALGLCLALGGCGGGHVHDWVEATCTEPLRCLRCGAEVTQETCTVGHTPDGTGTVCTVCGADLAALEAGAEERQRYEENCRLYTYEELTGQAERLYGAQVYVSGRVAQTVPGEDRDAVLLEADLEDVQPDGDSQGWLYVEWPEGEALPQEGASVSTWGELLSPYRWQGLDGSWNEAPHVRARYAE